MSEFTASLHCQMRWLCPACRNYPEWRAVSGAPEDCPHGVTIDSLPAVVDFAAALTERLTMCKECGDASCSIKHQTDCRLRAILGRQNFHCPDERF